MAIPWATPTIEASARGEFITLSGKSVLSPRVTPKTPPFGSAMSSPHITIFGFRSISSFRAWLSVSSIVTGVAANDVGLDETWTAPLPHACDDRLEILVHVGEPCAVNMDGAHPEPAGDVLQVGPRLDCLRDADRVAVVLYQEQHR